MNTMNLKTLGHQFAETKSEKTFSGKRHTFLKLNKKQEGFNKQQRQERQQQKTPVHKNREPYP